MKRQVVPIKAAGRSAAKPGTELNARYLYAVVNRNERPAYPGIGIGGADVYAIPGGSVAAVVSDVPNPKIRPERLHLAAHQEVLKCLMKECRAVLPMSFGIIAGSPDAVHKILTRNQEALAEQLRYVEGKVEMGLRVTWDVPNIFEYFVNTHPELAAARDRFFGPQRQPTNEDKMHVGRMFENMLREDQDTHAQKVETLLADRGFAIKRNACRNEYEVMSLACLVESSAIAGFEAAVFDAAKLFDNHFAFDYNGPWAPHNFVTVSLQAQDAD